MAAVQYYFSGEARWAKVYPHNKDEYKGKTFFSLDLVVDEDTAERFVRTGSQHKPRLDPETGKKLLKLRRNEINEQNPEWGGPPKVISEVDGKLVDFVELIGNGSEVTVRLTIYDSGQGKGTRLDVVRVDKLVEFGGTRVDTSGLDIGVPF